MVVSLLLLRRDESAVLLWMTIASFLVVHSWYWTNTRMRAPLTGILIVLSVAGWSWLLGRGRPGEAESSGASKRPD